MVCAYYYPIVKLVYHIKGFCELTFKDRHIQFRLFFKTFKEENSFLHWFYETLKVYRVHAMEALKKIFFPIFDIFFTDTPLLFLIA